MREYEKTLYYPKHARRWRKHQQDWATMLDMDLLENWDSPRMMPDLVESMALVPALECLLYGDRQHGDAFLRRAIQAAERIVSLKRCEQEGTTAERRFPLNVAKVVRTWTYSSWLLGGDLDRRSMQQISKWLAEWCLTKAPDRKRFRDALTMGFYLQAIRAALISCDIARAAELINSPRPLLWHHDRERAAWKRLIEAYPHVSEELTAQCEALFDQVRDPDFCGEDQGVPTVAYRDVLALEVGIIREMYFVQESAMASVNAEEVLKALAR